MAYNPALLPKCKLLCVLCGEFARRRPEERKNYSEFPFPEITSAGRLEVQILVNPMPERFCNALKLFDPELVYIQGEQVEDEEATGGLVWGTHDVSDPQVFSSLFGQPLPTTVYLEVPNGENIARALHSKGVPYVIYWNNAFSCYEASHFRQALLSVIQSSCSHTWDVYQLAHASFQIYCARSNRALPVNRQDVSSKIGPYLLGDPPNISIALPETRPDEVNTFNALPAIKIYDDDVNMRVFVCGVPCKLDACLLGSLEDGLSALLNIEIRGSKLGYRVCATPPPLQDGTSSHGVVTMRCDLTTLSSTYLSLLVSSSAQTFLNDQILECHIKSKLIEKCQLVCALPNIDESKRSLSERKSVVIPAGESVFEVRMRVPKWAAQILKQLAREFNHRSLVALGIACCLGAPVASFEEDDAKRLLFFFVRKEANDNDGFLLAPPAWCVRPTRVRQIRRSHKLNIALYRPVLCSRKNFMRPYPRSPETGAPQNRLKPDSLDVPVAEDNPNLLDEPLLEHNAASSTPARKLSMSSSSCTPEIISPNPVPVKKHGCNRSPIRVCSQEEFLRDVMQFLIDSGNARLVPEDASKFPRAKFMDKPVDLYNLYREVVARGGFSVENGINWRGQVFPKMSNYTVTNTNSGVGYILKKHYKKYLLQYESAHDDVDTGFCFLCDSNIPGDWVNCGVCGQWVHYDCDKRQYLHSFKDYAKADGIEYICPYCSHKKLKKESQQLGTVFSQTPSGSRQRAKQRRRKNTGT